MEPNEVSDVFGVIDTEEHVVPATPAAKEEKPKPAGEPAKPVETTDTDDERVEDTQDFSRLPKDEVESTEEVETPTETNTETETKTETAAIPEVDWKATLPPPPAPYNGPVPEVNEEGQITNMTPAEYQRYIIESSKSEMREESYAAYVENTALEQAEKILPELKTSPEVRQLVQATRIASVYNGKQIDSYEAAKLVKAALGIAPEKIAAAKAEGVQNAKTHIEVQKLSAVETTGATQKKVAKPKSDNLDKRLRAGDDEAFAELFESWNESGKL